MHLRPLFRKYSSELDTTADFVIYKAEGSRMCEEEIIKQLQDMRRLLITKLFSSVLFAYTLCDLFIFHAYAVACLVNVLAMWFN